jgi:hypothetical protein
MKTTRRIGISLLAGMALLVGTAGVAGAQYQKYLGKIVVTQKPLPEKQDELQRFLDKSAQTALDPDKGSETWSFSFYAALTTDPPQDMLEIGFYEYVSGNYKRVNLDDLKVGGKQVTGTYKLHKLIGYGKGKRYQMRILLRGPSGGEKVFARSGIITLK